jgi:predicted transcriptional regulator
MTWSEYAKFIGLAESALYRLLAGGKPSRLTVVKVQQKQRERVAVAK